MELECVEMIKMRYVYVATPELNVITMYGKHILLKKKKRMYEPAEEHQGIKLDFLLRCFRIRWCKWEAARVMCTLNFCL